MNMIMLTSLGPQYLLRPLAVAQSSLRRLKIPLCLSLETEAKLWWT